LKKPKIERKKYPLILFDAINVVALALLERQRSKKDVWNFKDRIWEIFSMHSSFCKGALRNENSNGACLAFLRAKEILRKAKELGFDIRNDSILTDFFEMGACSFLFKEFSNSDFSSKPIFEDVGEIYTELWTGYDLHDIAMRFLLRSDKKRLGVSYFDYVKYLGKKFKTSFGLNFDWRTGN